MDYSFRKLHEASRPPQGSRRQRTHLVPRRAARRSGGPLGRAVPAEQVALAPAGEDEGEGGAPVGTAAGSPPSQTPIQSGVRLVVYPFPVRPDVFAELKLPADLTAEEAERLSGFLRSVALASV